MGGGNKELDRAQSNAINFQTDLGKDLVALGRDEFGRKKELQAPYEKQQRDLATGNIGTMMSTMSVPMGMFKQQAKASRDQIMNTMPPGAARDYALAELDRNEVGGTYDFLRSAYLQAPVNLAQLSTEAGNFGLQATGQGANDINSGITGRQGQMQVAAQRQAAWMGMIGNIAGMAAGGLAAKKW